MALFYVSNRGEHLQVPGALWVFTTQPFCKQRQGLLREQTFKPNLVLVRFPQAQRATLLHYPATLTPLIPRSSPAGKCLQSENITFISQRSVSSPFPFHPLLLIKFLFAALPGSHRPVVSEIALICLLMHMLCLVR